MTQFIVEVVKTSKKKQKSVLAKNIIAGREELGLTAEKFAEEAKIPYPTLRDIEADLSGGRKATLEKIAATLGVEEWQLKQPDLFAGKQSGGVRIEKHESNEYSPKNGLREGHNNDSNYWTDEKLDPKRINPNTGSAKPNNVAHKVDDIKEPILDHKTESDQNENNFSRPSLILEIQDILKVLSQNDLEALKAMAENMPSVATVKRGVK